MEGIAQLPQEVGNIGNVIALSSPEIEFKPKFT